VDAGDTPSCTFVNTKQGSIKIIKDVVPANDPQDFAYTAAGTGMSPANFSLDDDLDGTLPNEQLFSGLLPNGARTVTETVPAGWDITNIACTGQTGSTIVIGAAGGFNAGDNSVSVTLAAGENIVCTFTNTKRATVTVNKREGGGLPLTRAWEFQIRSGATPAASGTIEATGTAVLATGVVNFACSPQDATCVNVGGIANLVPGNYQLCEINMPAGWANNIAGFTPNGEAAEGADNGNECINITLAAGATGVPTGVPNPIDNAPPPGGDARTIGYWKNHSCAARGNQEDALSAELPILLTTGEAPADFDWLINNCQTVVYLLDKRDIGGNHTKRASDAAYGLAAQLAAALLNKNAGAGSCAAADAAIAAGQLLLDQIDFDGTGAFLPPPKGNGPVDPLRTQALSLAATLDAYNNNTLCTAP
jgi:hypothetical protein